MLHRNRNAVRRGAKMLEFRRIFGTAGLPFRYDFLRRLQKRYAQRAIATGTLLRSGRHAACCASLAAK